MTGLVAISKTCQLVVKQGPILKAEGKCILPLKCIVERFRRLDLPSIPQMYIPVEVPKAAMKLVYLTPNARKCDTADLTNIALYYLLCSGEYTKPRKVKHNGQMVRATCTVQLRVYDIGFWKDNKILLRHLPLDLLTQAYSATMKISKKKWVNGSNPTPGIHRSQWGCGLPCS